MMPDQDASQPPAAPIDDAELRGLARDFATYAELERERQRNSLDDFDPELFDAAVELVMQKLHLSPES